MPHHAVKLILASSLTLAGCGGAASSRAPDASPTPSAAAIATAVAAPTSPYGDVDSKMATGSSVSIEAGDVGYLGSTDTHVWAAGSAGVWRIDPKDLSVVHAQALGGWGLAASSDGVWATDVSAGTVYSLDPTSGTRLTSAKLPGDPNGVAVLGDRVWVAQHHGGTVTVLDAKTLATIKEISVGSTGPGGPHGVAVSGNDVWVGLPNNGTIVRIDGSTFKVLGAATTTSSPCGGIIVQATAIWVSSCFDDHFAIRVDPATNKVVAEVDIAGNNGGAFLVDDRAWFPVGNRVVRIDPATNRVDRVVEFVDDPTFEAYGSTVSFDSAWIGGSGRVIRIPLNVLRE